MRYLNLARHIARQYAGGNEPWDDLFQVASVALVHAIDRYDPERGVSFSSFAVPTIRGGLRRHFRDKGWVVRPPRSLQELAPRAESTRDSLGAVLGRPATVADVAGALGVEHEAVREALQVKRLTSAEPLSTYEAEDDDRAALATAGVEEEGYVRAESRAVLERLLQGLTAREREVVRLRFVEDRTQQDIADRIGVSQMHVSRLLAVALERMSTMAAAA